MAFAQDLQSLTQAKYSNHLSVLNSRDIVDTAVADSVKQIQELGVKKNKTYVEDRLVNQTVPITYPIKRNNLHHFSWPPVIEKSRKQLQLSFLKNDSSLFSRLYISSQICHGDLDEFFQHENQAYSP